MKITVTKKEIYDRLFRQYEAQTLATTFESFLLSKPWDPEYYRAFECTSPSFASRVMEVYRNRFSLEMEEDSTFNVTVQVKGGKVFDFKDADGRRAILGERGNMAVVDRRDVDGVKETLVQEYPPQTFMNIVFERTNAGFRNTTTASQNESVNV